MIGDSSAAAGEGSVVKWAEVPSRYMSHDVVIRFNFWRGMGVWKWIFDEVSDTYLDDIQMGDNSSIRLHQCAATAQNK